MKDTYLSLAFVHGSTTQHSSLYTAVKVTTWGFGTKKKNLPLGSALHYVTQALFWLCTQNFECQLTWSDLCSVIRSVICHPIRDPIRDLFQVFSTLSMGRHGKNISHIKIFRHTFIFQYSWNVAAKFDENWSLNTFIWAVRRLAQEWAKFSKAKKKKPHAKMEKPEIVLRTKRTNR